MKYHGYRNLLCILFTLNHYAAVRMQRAPMNVYIAGCARVRVPIVQNPKLVKRAECAPMQAHTHTNQT